MCDIKGVSRENADKVRIADLSRDEIEQWRTGYIKAAGTSHAKKAAAQTSSNSIIRSCKAIFSAKPMEKLNLTELPNPFQKVKLLPTGDLRFQNGGIDASKLLEQAVAELAGTDVEVFKTIVLALCLGLRRGEIDKIEYDAFNLEAGTLLVSYSEHLHPKSQRSCGVVEIEPALIPIVRGWQAKATSSFVLESEVKPRHPFYSTGRQENFGICCDRTFPPGDPGRSGR